MSADPKIAKDDAVRPLEVPSERHVEHIRRKTSVIFRSQILLRLVGLRW